jgi:hypothetical protein
MGVVQLFFPLQEATQVHCPAPIVQPSSMQPS